ncbi:MAG: hypothetical protein KatS3mg109_0444 [Pirellulaceae bacterium]|nr:MAG: hypothetical protein KatS3mg109_0444 [Pirellulaceae bacterium]
MGNWLCQYQMVGVAWCVARRGKVTGGSALWPPDALARLRFLLTSRSTFLPRGKDGLGLTMAPLERRPNPCRCANRLASFPRGRTGREIHNPLA